MTVYISLLRGINVGGQKAIKMADLRALYEALGFANVQSYVQSGNVIFASDDTAASVSKTIRDGISEKYGFSVDITVRTVDEWRKLKEANPYIQDRAKDPKHLHVTLLNAPPDDKHLSKLEGINTGGDEYIIIEDVIYLYCPNGYGRSKLTNNFWEQKLKVSATTRNWNTVNKLLEMAEVL